VQRRDGRSFTFDIIEEIGGQDFLLDPIDARRLVFPLGGLMMEDKPQAPPISASLEQTQARAQAVHDASRQLFRKSGR
jgi:hypothetical protein